MESYNLAAVTKKIYNSGLKLFSLNTLIDIIGVRKESTIFYVIKSLLDSKVLFKFEKNKYVLNDSNIHDFIMANFVYQPSYISFETALNYYGILSQFPYEITSGTPKKTANKIINGKSFNYIHLKKDLYWGYEKKQGYLIALPEKALLDQLYLTSKGLRRLNTDECDFSRIDRLRMKDYVKKYPQTGQFTKVVKLLNTYIHI